MLSVDLAVGGKSGEQRGVLQDPGSQGSCHGFGPQKAVAKMIKI